MEVAMEALRLYLNGGWDCIRGIFKLITNYLISFNNELSRENVERLSLKDTHDQGNVTRKVKSKLYACFAFGLYFILSYLIFDYYILQSAFIQLVEWAGEDVNSAFVIVLKNILHILFLFLWILPMLCLSKFLNFNWYQDIANSVLLESGQKKYEDLKFSEFYADQIKSFVLQMIFCFQGFMIYFPYCPFPWFVQTAWYCFHCALLTSLYAFEYKWVYSGWPLERRLLNIATKWPYYLGFGTLLAYLSYKISSFILSMIVFATLFPVYVVGSSFTQDKQSPAFRYPLHIFKIADCLSEWLIKVAYSGINIAFGKKT